MGLQNSVKDFHHKHGFPIEHRLEECPVDSNMRHALLAHGDKLVGLSKQMLVMAKSDDYKGDFRPLRAHLMLEELGETLRAMAVCDEIGTLDGLADLMYVTLGTGVVFDLPVDAAFVEVHRSNMTKAVQVNDPDKIRLRDKGPDYVPPDLRAVLEDYRYGCGQPEVVCLCGSTKFKDQFISENRRLTLEGKIVLSVGFFGHTDGMPDPATKAGLDLLHLRKIDLADRVRVINVGGYVGEGTGREIAYAKKLGKPISYLEAEVFNGQARPAGV